MIKFHDKLSLLQIQLEYGLTLRDIIDYDIEVFQKIVDDEFRLQLFKIKREKAIEEDKRFENDDGIFDDEIRSNVEEYNGKEYS